MRDHELLLETMKSHAWELTRTENPADIKKGRGRTFTVSYSRQNATFQTTQSDERVAFCVAALKAYGWAISNDQ